KAGFASALGAGRSPLGAGRSPLGAGRRQQLVWVVVAGCCARRS
ncbi:hypothetical protein A2U01_0073233, partial [Trifolium medium]|nr:hypothetical protein [Trifolium medium]